VHPKRFEEEPEDIHLIVDVCGRPLFSSHLDT
jgi:hypothetical protein